MQLRKFKTAAIWTADLDALAGFAKEQKAAKGNFPGPCPIIYNGNSEHLAAAAERGANAVVLGAGEMSKAEAAGKLGLEVIWSVSSAEEARPIVDAGAGEAFLMDELVARDLVRALPKEALKIAVVGAMQPDNAEIASGRALAVAGCKAVLVQKACVGDSEDLHYTGVSQAALSLIHACRHTSVHSCINLNSSIYLYINAACCIWSVIESQSPTLISLVSFQRNMAKET